jgi:putative tryptophan/tyrosine transport system substrate-binding protein
MTGLRLRDLLVVWLAMTTTAVVAGESRVLIVREDSAVSRQAADLLVHDLGLIGWTAAEAAIGSEQPLVTHLEHEQMLVALGARALAVAQRHAGGRPLVAALVGQSTLEETAYGGTDRLSAILLDQPPERWGSLIQAAFPNLQQVGMLVGPASQKVARLAERKLADRRLTLVTESVSSQDDVVPALERLLPRMGLMLALPDPLVHNRNTVQPLLLTTYRAGIPVVAYSESYQQAGAVLALYSTIPQIVAQVIETIQQIQEGRPPPAVQWPRHFTVGVNTSVARSLGLSLPSGAELPARLRGSGQ